VWGGYWVRGAYLVSKSWWGVLTDNMVEAPPLKAVQLEARRRYCRSLASAIATILGLTINFTGLQATRSTTREIITPVLTFRTELLLLAFKGTVSREIQAFFK
jgi:hypothetical protein